MRPLLAAGLLVTAAVIAAACGGDDEPPPQAVGGNVFPNPGFESGADPWLSLETEAWGKPFSVSDRQARSGTSSALLELRSEAEEGAARVYGVVQEVEPDSFPEVISGSYFVERWERGTPLQYLQAVVIVWNASNAPDIPSPNHQIRYILAGIDVQPFELRNAQYVFLGGPEPQLGAWVDFELDVAADFERLWGAVPEGFDSIRVLFEVRWDGRTPAEPPSVADVFYDDLYMGPR